MKRVYWLIMASFILSGSVAKAQKPLMPTFNYLTIDPTSGNPTMYWTPPVFNPLYPDPTGYIIYKRVIDALSPLGRNEAIDTVGPGITSYTDLSSNGNLGKLTYLLASNGPTEPSQLTSLHSSIFITCFYDSCNHKLDLTWNHYQGWGNHILNYYIYVGNNPNWTTFPLYSHVSGTRNTLSITNVQENQDYYIYIVAEKDTNGIGGVPYKTRSNLFHKFTKMPVHPTYMSIDSILAEDNKINLYFKIDTATELNNFQIVRWESSDSIESIFSKKTINTFSNPKQTYYADTEDSWAARTRPFYYKIDAFNPCPIIVKVSNLSNSITPKVQSHGMVNFVKWDSLHIDDKSHYVKYRVIRYTYTDVALPPVYLPEVDSIQLKDDVHSFEGQDPLYSIKFCYQIEAHERDILGQDVMLSRSRIQCTEIVPGVTMPNAICPTDTYTNNGKSRNILVPVITFRANYTLSVYGRWGNLIFSGENEGWNGHLSNGALANEGTYLYRLVVHTSGNRDVTKTGSVTVIYH